MPLPAHRMPGSTLEARDQQVRRSAVRIQEAPLRPGNHLLDPRLARLTARLLTARLHGRCRPAFAPPRDTGAAAITEVSLALSLSRTTPRLRERGGWEERVAADHRGLAVATAGETPHR